MVVPPISTPKWSFLVGKRMVVGPINFFRLWCPMARPNGRESSKEKSIEIQNQQFKDYIIIDLYICIYIYNICIYLLYILCLCYYLWFLWLAQSEMNPLESRFLIEFIIFFAQPFRQIVHSSRSSLLKRHGSWGHVCCIVFHVYHWLLKGYETNIAAIAISNC